MPLPIRLKQKKIRLNDDCKPIIEIIANMTSGYTKNMDVSPLKETGRIKNESTWDKFVSFLNFFSDINIKNDIKTDIIIPSVEFELDAPAYMVYQFYQNYLNEILKKANLDASNTEKETIENKTTLLREILLRMVGITLRVKLDDIEHGEKMIKYLSTFIEKLNYSEIFVEKSRFSKDKLSTESISLVTDHNDWIQLLSGMVKVIKIIHAPDTSLSTVLAYLEQIKLTLARYIIVLSEYSLKADELSDSWLITTFINFEKTMQDLVKDDLELEKKSIISTESKTIAHPLITEGEYSQLNIELSLEHWQCTKSSISQEYVIKGVTKKIDLSLPSNKYKLEKIKNLYHLFNKTNLLFQAVMQMESLIQVGGWVPILMGILNTTNLSTMIDEHDHECRNSLKISADELKSNLSNKAYHQLVKYSPCLFTGVHAVTHNLQILNSKEIRTQLIKLISGSLNQLKNLEKDILNLYKISDRSRYSLINSEKIGDIIFSNNNAASESEMKIMHTEISRFDSNCVISGDNIDEYIYRLVNNTHINLAHKKLGDAGIIKLSEKLNNNTSILELNLYDNNLSKDVIGYIVKIIKNNKHLVHLNLGLNNLDDACVNLLVAALNIHKSVKHLCLFRNKITTIGLNDLASLITRDGFIEEIDISSNKIDIEEFLIKISVDSTLTSLHISSIPKHMKTYDLLAKFIKQSKKINYISCSNNGDISDVDASALANAVMTNISLKHLNLLNCRLNPAGIKSLSGAIKYRSKHKRLVIQNTQIGEIQHTNTRDISYYKTKVSDIKNDNFDNSVKLANTYIKLFKLMRNTSDNENEHVKKAWESISFAQKSILPMNGDINSLSVEQYIISYLKAQLKFQEKLQLSLDSAIDGLYDLALEMQEMYEKAKTLSKRSIKFEKFIALYLLILLIIKNNYTTFIQRHDKRNKFEIIGEDKSYQIPGLVYEKVPGDGHCLFHAVGYHVSQDQASLRKIVATHLEGNKNDFRAVIEIEGQTIEKYIESIRNGKEWADNIEIEVLMRVLERPIIVIGPDLKIRNQEVLEKRFHREPIFVLYNGNNHYDAFLRAEGANAKSIIDFLKQPDSHKASKSQLNEHSHKIFDTLTQLWEEIYIIFIKYNVSYYFKKEFDQLPNFLRVNIVKFMEENCEQSLNKNDFKKMKYILRIVDDLKIENANFSSYKGLLALYEGDIDLAEKYKDEAFKMDKWNIITIKLKDKIKEKLQKNPETMIPFHI